MCLEIGMTTEEELEILRAALDHYADKKNWHVLPIWKDAAADNQIRRFFNNGDAVDGWKVAEKALGRDK